MRITAGLRGPPLPSDPAWTGAVAGPGRGGRLRPPLALCSPGREPGSGRDGLLRLGPRIWKDNPQPGPRLAAAPRLPRSITQPRVCPACPAPQNHAPGEEAVPGRPEGRREQHGPVPGGQAVGRGAAVLEGPCRPDLPPEVLGAGGTPQDLFAAERAEAQLPAFPLRAPAGTREGCRRPPGHWKWQGPRAGSTGQSRMGASVSAGGGGPRELCCPVARPRGRLGPRSQGRLRG